MPEPEPTPEITATKATEGTSKATAPEASGITTNWAVTHGSKEEANLPAWVSDDVRIAAGDDSECQAAVAFNDRFGPLENVEYGWVVKHAQDQFQAAVGLCKLADEKAGSLIGYLGSAAGLLAIGSSSGVLTGKVPLEIAVSGLPSFALAIAAVVCAGVARRTGRAPRPPAIREAAEAANFYPGNTEAAAGSLLGQWDLSAAMMYRTSIRKTSWLEWATWSFVASIASLLLPLLVAICMASR